MMNLLNIKNKGTSPERDEDQDGKEMKGGTAKYGD
jgi:hypothetical protein